MGCFDNISFAKYSRKKFPLPKDVGEAKGIDFQSLSYQTKDLGQSMGAFEVRKDGYLYKIETSWLDSYTVNDEPIRYDLTGYVEFYESIQNDEYENDYWIEYKAHFVKGKVKGIELLKWEGASNASRKLMHAQTEAELKRHFEFQRKWYFKYAYKPYSTFIKSIFRLWRRLKNAMPYDYTIQNFLMNPIEAIEHQKRIRRLIKENRNN